MSENEKIVTSTIELDVNVKVFNKELGELTEVLVANAKLKKADISRVGYNQEDATKINIFAKQNVYESPRVSVKTTTKMTKADSGRA